MIPVKQTMLGQPGGNCFPACIASIFEVPIEEVPHPTLEEQIGDDEDGWLRYLERLQRDFLDARHLRTIFFPVGKDWFPTGYSILAVRAGRYLHCVVCLNGEIVWDPHPPHPLSGHGMGEGVDWTLFYCTDPTKIQAKIQNAESSR